MGKRSETKKPLEKTGKNKKIEKSQKSNPQGSNISRRNSSDSAQKQRKACRLRRQINQMPDVQYQAQISGIRETIEANIRNDYEGQYSEKNTIYAEQKALFRKQKKISKNELKILEWFETFRGRKYDEDLPGAIIPPKTLQPHVVTCKFTKKLVKSLHQYQKILSVPITIGKFTYELKKTQKRHQHQPHQTHLDQNLSPILALYKTSQGKKEIKPHWFAQKTFDRRYIWRSSIAIDQLNVLNLLKFLLTKRLEKQQCPSIAINAGSHGVISGRTAYTAGREDLLDERIIDQTHAIIYQFLSPGIIDHLKDVSLEKPNVYPINANHIIDTHCYGALSPIKPKWLNTRKNSYQQKTLKFLACKCERPSFFWHSSIIKSKKHEDDLLKFFETSRIQVKDVKLLFKASYFQFDIQKYFEKCGKQTQTMVICKTSLDKIIGAYTPLSQLKNQRNQNQKGLKSYDQCPDKTGKSFIFSLTQNDKFSLKRESTRAIYRVEDKARIIFGRHELTIGDGANIKESCRSCTNLEYFNEKYGNPSDFNDFNLEACKKMNGSEKPSFKTKEWEVWKIIA